MLSSIFLVSHVFEAIIQEHNASITPKIMQQHENIIFWGTTVLLFNDSNFPAFHPESNSSPKTEEHLPVRWDKEKPLQ